VANRSYLDGISLSFEGLVPLGFHPQIRAKLAKACLCCDVEGRIVLEEEE
jgi:hypothetical protein